MDRTAKVLLGLLGVFLLVEIALSLQWRFQHDSPILLYAAFLMDRFGYLPYRDFFDMNMPGTYWIYLLIGRITGFQDIGFRLVDLALLGILSLMTYAWMRKFGEAVALTGAILFGLAYLWSGPYLSMQREYLALIPLVAGIWILGYERVNWPIRGTTVGLLFGICANIKPQMAIGLVPVLILEATSILSATGQKRIGLLRLLAVRIIPIFSGFAVPFVAMIAYLWSQNILGDFVDMASNYWPLHGSLSGSGQTLAGSERWFNLVEGYASLGGQQAWLASAAMGIFFFFFRSASTPLQKRQVILTILLAVAYSFYPVFSGQFWNYHWLLFTYFIIQLSALCLVQQEAAIPIGERLFPTGVLAMAILLNLYPIRLFVDPLRGRPVPAPKFGRADEIASFLQFRLRPGDTVQPLDWTGGAVHGMLMAGAQLATPFVGDFNFYHHVSNPYVQGLRQRFIQALEKAHPRFIVDVYSVDKPWVWGEDTTREFPALQAILDQEYRVVSQGNGYRIYEIERLDWHADESPSSVGIGQGTVRH